VGERRKDPAGAAEVLQEPLLRVLEAPVQHAEGLLAELPQLPGGDAQAGVLERLQPERNPPGALVPGLASALLRRFELEADPEARSCRCLKMGGPSLDPARQAPEQRPATGDARVRRHERAQPSLRLILLAVKGEGRRVAPG